MRLEQFKLKTYFKKYRSGLYQFMCLSQNKIMKYRWCKESEIIFFKLQFEFIFYVTFCFQRHHLMGKQIPSALNEQLNSCLCTFNMSKLTHAQCSAFKGSSCSVLLHKYMKFKISPHSLQLCHELIGPITSPLTVVVRRF